MSGLPEVTITGTVVADPELRRFASGACVANFTVAANDRRFDRERGEWVDAGATFLRCSVWQQAAEHVCESLSKGDRVLAVGALRQRSWENDNGEKRTAFELDVNEVGASLRFANAKPAKVKRSHGAPPDADRWSSAPPATTAAANEPPF